MFDYFFPIFLFLIIFLVLNLYFFYGLLKSIVDMAKQKKQLKKRVTKTENKKFQCERCGKEITMEEKEQYDGLCEGCHDLEEDELDEEFENEIF